MFEQIMDREIKADLFADYSQFYLQDEGVVNDDHSGAWSQEAVDRMLAVSPGSIIVGTVRNMTVPVTVRIFQTEPDILSNLNNIGQINECDLVTNSNKLVLSGCTDYLPDALRIDVEKGIYRARVYYGNLDTISEDGLEGDDFYEIHFWPTDKQRELKILKDRNTSA